MPTIYWLIDAVLIRFGTGYCQYCHRFTRCVLVWNEGQERFNPACPDCAPGQLGVTRERYYAMLEEPEENEDDEALEVEEPMTTGQLVRTLIGLMLIAALYSFTFTYWGAHDRRISEPFMIWVATPVVNLVAIAMACLQIHFYRQGQDREGNS